MKRLRQAGMALSFITLINALVALLVDGRTNSLLVFILMLAPWLVMLTVFAINFPKMWGHPKFGGYGGSDTAEIITSVLGSKKDWRFYDATCAIGSVTGGGYMVYEDRGMALSGVVFLIANISSWTIFQIDTTVHGRRIGRVLGVPLTPENELDFPLGED